MWLWVPGSQTKCQAAVGPARFPVAWLEVHICMQALGWEETNFFSIICDTRGIDPCHPPARMPISDQGTLLALGEKHMLRGHLLVSQGQ
jgi:hypothetical protein